MDDRKFYEKDTWKLFLKIKMEKGGAFRNYCSGSCRRGIHRPVLIPPSNSTDRTGFLG